MYTFAIVLATICVKSQTVTTYLNSNAAHVDDAMALDSQGNLYGSTFYGGEVFKITPDGTISSFVSGLAWANGLAVDSEDNIYVAEYLNASINKYDHDGNLIEKMSIGSGYPSGLIKAFDSDNMIYTDVGNNSINELAQDGTVTTLYQGNPLNIPVGLAYGPAGDLYIGNYIGREIYRLPRNSSSLEYVATVPAPNNHVPYLAFIAYAQGFLYGTVYGEHKIYQIDPRNIDDVEIYSGSVYGNDDGNISEATYAYPAGIISNRSGNTLYVSEFTSNGNIRKITNGNGRNAVNNDTMFTLQVYPNPASEILYIQPTSNKKEADVYFIKLYDINTGRIVLEESASLLNKKLGLRVSTLKKGIYELVISNNNISESQTIVIH